ncbi:serine/threonine-protein kinase [Paenibacillus sp. GM1FR]|uniref:serine/threonine-protein kinase n=1 Tax=Paenibacillus sp. GM1FR TaxID=2059267 RepID=UPI000C26FA5E|nr:serine/threonine-protein kinase [Paenibacillus sp. GM1FR]
MTIIDGKYVLKKELYSGPQSQVFNGHHIKNENSTVTIKLLNNNFPSENRDVEEIFKRDSKALSLLNNSNIIEYKDSGLDDNVFYIVMEHFQGLNLYEYISSKPSLTYYEKLTIMMKISNGIQAAHDKRIIHRDIKPTNILINVHQDIKIIDFGVSKILDFNAYRTNYTLKDYITKRYASPEHQLGKEVDLRTDIYSLGCVLFYLLTEQEPPEDKDSFENEIDKANLSDFMKVILLKLIKINKTERYASILLFIRDLEEESERETYKSGVLKVLVPKMICIELEKIGKISNTNFRNVKSYIENSLSDPYIYKNINSKYYLIGDEVKYQIIPELNKGYFKIIKVFGINSYADNEVEKQKGIELSLNVDVTSITPNNIQAKKELESLLNAINLKLANFKKNKERSYATNKLISDWENIIKEISKINIQRSQIGSYRKLDYDETKNYLIVTMESGFEPSYIQDGDYLKLRLTSDKQISVGEIKEVKDNTIFVALKTHIDESQLSQRGEARIDLSKDTENIKRFDFALRKLRYGAAVNKDLLDILIDPSILTVKKVDLTLDFVNQQLDSSNQNAVKEAMKTNDIFLIQGPPGTGKSTVITEIIDQIFKDDNNSKVLITSPSHVAVDHLLKNIVERHKTKKIIRIGTSDKISKDSSNLLASEQIKKWSEEVKKNSVEFCYDYLTRKSDDKELEKYIKYNLLKGEDTEENEVNPLVLSSKRDATIVSIIKDWTNRLGLIDEFDDIFAMEASIVAATCAGIASRHILKSLTYDWVIVDEAARATAPELILPMLLGKKIILVGDHKQLPPIVNLAYEQELRIGSNTKNLDKSLFEEIFNRSAGEAQVTLTSQFRMHSTISKLVNKCFYPSYEIKSKASDSKRQHYLDHENQIIWHDTSYSKNNYEEKINKSYRNTLESTIILDELVKYNDICNKKEIVTSVAVISGYSAQKQLLINKINPDSPRWTNLKIQIDNIDAFQGSETDIVFYSIVRSNENNDIGFLKDERRLNVALSRGKKLLFIVGNKETACDYRQQGNSFNKIVSFIKANPKNCTIRGENIE